MVKFLIVEGICILVFVLIFTVFLPRARRDLENVREKKARNKRFSIQGYPSVSGIDEHETK